MARRKKIIAGAVGLAIAATLGTVSLDKACVFDDEVLMVSDEKICMTTDSYADFKGKRINNYLKHSGMVEYRFNESTEEREALAAVLTHELEKMPDFVFNGELDGEGIMEQLINNLP